MKKSRSTSASMRTVATHGYSMSLMCHCFDTSPRLPDMRTGCWTPPSTGEGVRRADWNDLQDYVENPSALWINGHSTYHG